MIGSYRKVNRARSLFVLFALFTLFASAKNIFAQRSQAGTSAAQFLKIGAGARAMGLAGAFTAISDDATAIYWNPAGLGRLTEGEMILSQNNFPGFYEYSFLSWGQPLSKRRVHVGGALTLLRFKDIPKLDNTGVALGSYGATDSAFAVSLSHAWGRFYSSGLTFKGVSQKIDTQSALTAAMDIGILRQVNNFNLGLAVLNLGPSLRLGPSSAPLPVSLKGGAAICLARRDLTASWFAVDAALARDNAVQMHAGLEYWMALDLPVNAPLYLAFRSGYATETATSRDPFSGVRGGIGLIFKRWGFDFAFVPMAELGNAYQLGLRLKL